MLKQKSKESIGDSYDLMIEKYKLSKVKEDALTNLDDETLRMLTANNREEIGQRTENLDTKQRA
jgi:hypothetical protein